MIEAQDTGPAIIWQSIRYSFAPEWLKPIISLTSFDVDPLDETQWSVWVSDVIGTLQDTGRQREEFVHEVNGQLSIDEKLVLIYTIFDHGWSHSGRRDVLPPLVEDLANGIAIRSSHEDAQLFLRQLRFYFQQHFSNNPIARELLDQFPVEMRDYEAFSRRVLQDLEVLELL